MKQRTKDYMFRKRAQRTLQHPDDLRTLLIAEYNSSRNFLVKKDISKMIDELQTFTIKP